MARAATSPELAYSRTPGKWSKVYAFIIQPPTVYTARINQTFTDYDQVLSFIYDTGSGTLANVLPDMEVWIGSSAGTYDKGICRLRDKDATHFYVSGTSEILFSDNDYVTIVAAFGVWARPARVTLDETTYMDETLYSNQHSSWDPQPNMGTDRVLELTGVSVSTTFHADTSFCPGSSIASYGWSAATALSSSGTTTATPTFTFNTPGVHLVYLTVTGANGKSFFGVRYVCVWNEANPPAVAEITDAGHCDVETGGWQVGLTLRSGVDLSTVHERAKIIIFSKDFYGSTQVNIGPVTGSENIKFIGWISSEVNHLASEAGSVSFTAHGAQHWMSKIPSWTDGVEITDSTPSAWTQVQSLTTDLGLYHFLRWRSTVTRIMDITLPGDTRLTHEVSSSAQNLWDQLKEMSWNKIYARPGVNALNQLSIQIHPALIPTGERVAPTVMTITKDDFLDGLDFERSIIPDVGIVDMSGLIILGFNNALAKFALSPGHALPHFGGWDIQPNLTLASQEQVITLSGLWRSWRNNKFKSIPIPFSGPMTLIDCFPNQKCNINIASSDNVRGWAYSGGLFPISASLIHDPATGYLHTEVTFEGETAESSARIGDTPGSGPTDTPPIASFPPLPSLPPIVPGWPIDPSTTGRGLIVHDQNNVGHTAVGVIYTSNIDISSPVWQTMNAGLDSGQRAAINKIIVCPNGAVYVAREGRFIPGHGDPQFLARSPGLGQPFTVLKTVTDWEAEYTDGGSLQFGCLCCRPDQPETVLYVAGDNIPPFGDVSNVGVYLGANTSFVKTMTLSDVRMTGMEMGGSFGQNTWGLTYDSVQGIFQAVKYHRLNSGATAQTAVVVLNGTDARHVRGGISGVIYVQETAVDNYMKRSMDNGDTWQDVPSPAESNGFGLAVDDTGQYLMANWQPGSGARGKSTDYGSTFVGLPNLPLSSQYRWAYLGGVGSASQWAVINITSSVVRVSLDDGESWLNREGNIATLGATTINWIVPIRTVVT